MVQSWMVVMVGTPPPLNHQSQLYTDRENLVLFLFFLTVPFPYEELRAGFQKKKNSSIFFIW